MVVPRWMLLAGALAVAPGCSRPEVADSASRTRQFLSEVGRVRAQMTADNLERIPAVIRRQDASMLTDEVARIGRYRLALSKLDPRGVDPNTVLYMQSVVAALEAYRAACMDTAEFFFELREADSKPSDRGLLAPAVGSVLQTSRGDTVAALDSVIGAVRGLDTTGTAIFLVPIANTIQADRARLSVAQHDQLELARQLSSAPEN
jgi:hypothetical protein